MTRISNTLAKLKTENKKALIPYIVAGDPSVSATVPLMHSLVAAGANIIELGVPFSDPMAEGPAIQLGHERALANGVSLNQVLEMVAEFRLNDDTTPVVLMGYANPVIRMGYDHFAEKAQHCGLDGLLTVDLPPEESTELTTTLREHHIDVIYLIAPTTTDERAQSIVDAASGYIYYVSLKGVTGAGNLDTSAVANRIGQLREMTDLPLCVGFGIKDAASAKAIAASADGAVVGSVLVNLCGSLAQLETDEICTQISTVIAEMRIELDK